MNIPVALKPLIPFVKRAEELDKDESTPDARTVAYFCRLYAIDKAMKLQTPANKADVTALVKPLLALCEKDKTVLGEDSTFAVGRRVCEGFAFSAFATADDEDRSGRVTKDTAKLFYNANTFFELLDQFGEMDEEVVAKRKYCKWKAQDIMRCIKEGCIPIPGAPGESVTPSAPPAQDRVIFHEPPGGLSIQSIPAPPAHFIPPKSSYIASSATKLMDGDNIDDAIEIIYYAMASLKVSNLVLAGQRLGEALMRLENENSPEVVEANRSTTHEDNTVGSRLIMILETAVMKLKLKQFSGAKENIKIVLAELNSYR